MEKIVFTVFPAESKIQALEKFGHICTAMSVAHATMLSNALWEKDGEKKLQWLLDAKNNLKAQMELAQIEMFIHNLPD